VAIGFKLGAAAASAKVRQIPSERHDLILAARRGVGKAVGD
jgi:hypothetical protein